MSSGSSGHELFVGQKVICVTESWKMGDTGINASGPGLRDIVTIREISNFCGVWLFFEEWPGRVNFDASKFRPIVEPKADISVFTKILDRMNWPGT